GEMRGGGGDALGDAVAQIFRIGIGAGVGERQHRDRINGLGTAGEPVENNGGESENKDASGYRQKPKDRVGGGPRRRRRRRNRDCAGGGSVPLQVPQIDQQLSR